MSLRYAAWNSSKIGRIHTVAIRKCPVRSEHRNGFAMAAVTRERQATRTILKRRFFYRNYTEKKGSLRSCTEKKKLEPQQKKKKTWSLSSILKFFGGRSSVKEAKTNIESLKISSSTKSSKTKGIEKTSSEKIPLKKKSIAKEPSKEILENIALTKITKTSSKTEVAKPTLNLKSTDKSSLKTESTENSTMKVAEEKDKPDLAKPLATVEVAKSTKIESSEKVVSSSSSPKEEIPKLADTMTKIAVQTDPSNISSDKEVIKKDLKAQPTLEPIKNANEPNLTSKIGSSIGRLLGINKDESKHNNSNIQPLVQRKALNIGVENVKQTHVSSPQVVEITKTNDGTTQANESKVIHVHYPQQAYYWTPFSPPNMAYASRPGTPTHSFQRNEHECPYCNPQGKAQHPSQMSSSGPNMGVNPPASPNYSYQTTMPNQNYSNQKSMPHQSYYNQTPMSYQNYYNYTQPSTLEILAAKQAEEQHKLESQSSADGSTPLPNAVAGPKPSQAPKGAYYYNPQPTTLQIIAAKHAQAVRAAQSQSPTEPPTLQPPSSDTGDKSPQTPKGTYYYSPKPTTLQIIAAKQAAAERAAQSQSSTEISSLPPTSSDAGSRASEAPK